MRVRLLWQIAGGYLAITVVLLTILGWYASIQAREFYLDRKAAELEAGARLGAAQLQSLLERGPDQVQPTCQHLGQVLGMRVTVVLPDGTVVGDSSEDPALMENHRNRPELQDALRGVPGRSTRFSTTMGEPLAYVAVPVLRDGTIIGAVRTSFSVRSMAQTVRAVYGRVALAGLLAVLAMTGASLLVARRIVRPLDAIRAGAQRFARGELQHRLYVEGAEEIQMLAHTMNAMAEQLDQRIQTIVRQQNEHEAVLASMNEGVLAVDQRGAILSLNATCAALLDVQAENVQGRMIHEVLRKADLLVFVERALASDKSIEDDFELTGPERRWLHAHGTALHDGHGRRIGTLIVLHDATRLRHLESVRRDFVANVSHELRTPITSIKGFVETVLHEGLENREQSLRFLQIVLRQVNRLNAIIEDLLLLSRVERGAEEQTIELGTERLAEVIRAGVEMCENKAAHKQIRIDVQCPTDLTARINAPLMEQAVMNLVDNAVKYSPEGGVVRVVAEACPTEVVIRVIDQGCGIAPNHLPRLFERFYRVDKTRSRELGGTGLGLAIVKHIVAAHKGSVQVQSALGRGSTFSIHLPNVEAAPAA